MAKHSLLPVWLHNPLLQCSVKTLPKHKQNCCCVRKGFSEPHGNCWYWADTELLHWAHSDSHIAARKKNPKSVRSPEGERGSYREECNRNRNTQKKVGTTTSKVLTYMLCGHFKFKNVWGKLRLQIAEISKKPSGFPVPSLNKICTC